MSAQEFMQRLAALVPRPRLHHIRFHGVLAPHAKLRAAVLPGTVEKPSEPAHEHPQRPAGIPAAVNERLTAALTSVMGSPELRTHLVGNGFDAEFQASKEARD